MRISPKRVCHRIHEMGYHARVAKLKPLISPRNKKKADFFIKLTRRGVCPNGEMSFGQMRSGSSCLNLMEGLKYGEIREKRGSCICQNFEVVIWQNF